MRDIKFSKTCFHEGLNTTCRLGIRNYLLGESIALCAVDGEFIHTAEVVCLFQGAFFDIPDELITEEHDPECTEYDTLLNVMKSLYDGFEKDDYITMIGFIINDDL